MKNIFKLIVSITVCELAGIIGAIFTTPAINTWYALLKKPSFSPANWVFSPIWTFLFLLMGISLFLIWKKGINNKKSKQAVIIFIVQLLFNIFWSAVFFGLKLPSVALMEIIALWLMILATILSFYKISKPAAWLLLPYILWVSFAAVLNYSFWRLN